MYSQNCNSNYSSGCAICNMIDELQRSDIIRSLQTIPIAIESNCTSGETHMEMQPIGLAAESSQRERCHLIQIQGKFMQQKKSRFLKIDFASIGAQLLGRRCRNILSYFIRALIVIIILSLLFALVYFLCFKKDEGAKEEKQTTTEATTSQNDVDGIWNPL